MKTLVVALLIAVPGAASATTNYYDSQGYLEGFSVQHGPHTMYYDKHGYLSGTRVDPDYNNHRSSAPSTRLTPIPSFKDDFTPPTNFDMIGDPE